MRRLPFRFVSLTLGCVLLAGPALSAQTSTRGVTHGRRPTGRLVIRNALVIEGNGTPTIGPYDIVVEGNRIVEMVPLDPVALREGRQRRPEAGAEIDGSGKYVLPGLINLHGHIQDERGGAPQPTAYQNKLWLASGITTVREVSSGADPKAYVAFRDQSAAGALEAPRFFICAGYTSHPAPRTPEQVRARVQELKRIGVDCIKIVGLDRDLLAAMLDEAHKLGLPVAHHAGVEETNAWDDIRFGTASIEHWYGVPDAAILDRVQNFPAGYNYSNEVDRFRYAGRLWREADPARLSMVLDSMVARGVAWDP
ncbi:MAG TPA: amidohydrolase family protein, partial [Gemmatimonadales bacterium]